MSDSPDEDSVLGYERYQYGPPRPAWNEGFRTGSTGDDVHRYVTHGAGVSAPSENLAFYFGGMRGEDWGEILEPIPRANETSDRLITVNMETMRSEEWSNTTLPSNVPKRSVGELVWVPTSESGVLVAIGGVKYPEDLFRSGRMTEDQGKENVSSLSITPRSWTMKKGSYIYELGGGIFPQSELHCLLLVELYRA